MLLREAAGREKGDIRHRSSWSGPQTAGAGAYDAFGDEPVDRFEPTRADRGAFEEGVVLGIRELDQRAVGQQLRGTTRGEQKSPIPRWRAGSGCRSHKETLSFRSARQGAVPCRASPRSARRGAARRARE